MENIGKIFCTVFINLFLAVVLTPQVEAARPPRKNPRVEVPSNLIYSNNSLKYTVGIAIGNINPSISGGTPTSYSVSPALPSGLNLDLVSGVISGTPTVESVAINYSIQASNSAGSTSTLITLSVTAARRVIMLTGYWPPSNEMLRPWSKNPSQNPGGWIGSNWENSGYDVVAYFPEYVDETDRRGYGDFEVDYADTQSDFNRITSQIKPISIISFGVSTGPWEIENSAHDYWDGTNVTLNSTFPYEDIRSEIYLNPSVHVYPWIWYGGDGGQFVCGYINYLAASYQLAHSDSTDPARTISQGFIHLGLISTNDTLEKYRNNLRATLRATIRDLDNKSLLGPLK